MKLNTIYIQEYTNTYCMPIRQLKNGGYYGLIYEDPLTGRYGGKAKKGSLRNWNPKPILANNVPEQITAKFIAAILISGMESK